MILISIIKIKILSYSYHHPLTITSPLTISYQYCPKLKPIIHDISLDNMPASRKRIKGKERKAKANALLDNLSLQLLKNGKCNHGLPLDIQDNNPCLSVIKKVENGLSMQIRSGKRAFDSYTSLFIALYVEDPHFESEMNIQVRDNTERLKACFISLATEYLLRGNDKDIIIAEGLAIAIVNINQVEEGSSATFNKMMSISRDLDEGGKRTVTRFINKRIECDCLEQKHEQSKKLPSLGKCENCRKQMERSKLFACNGCKVGTHNLAQYCSTRCQSQHWPKHKKRCLQFRIK